MKVHVVMVRAKDGKLVEYDTDFKELEKACKTLDVLYSLAMVKSIVITDPGGKVLHRKGK